MRGEKENALNGDNDEEKARKGKQRPRQRHTTPGG